VEIACLDLEGVLLPEIWVEFADKVGVEELKATTRDIPDYDELMRMRLRILDEHGYGVTEIREVIATLSPLPEPLNSLTGFANDSRWSFSPIPFISLLRR